MRKLALSLLALCLGSVAQAQVVPAPGPPTGIACAYNTSPVTLSSGQAGWVQCTSAGKLSTDATGDTGGVSNADNVAGTTGFPRAQAFNYVWDGSNWDRAQGLLSGTAGTASADVVTIQGIASMTPVLATLSGTNTVVPGNTANTTPWLTTSRGSAQDWKYAAAAAGISNTTTAVTIKTAGAGSDRNCITSIQISSDALGAATEFAVRDGAGGTVLWRTKIGTAGYINGFQTAFPSAICGTAATLLEVVTLTASITGAVFVNAQGYAAP